MDDGQQGQQGQQAQVQHAPAPITEPVRNKKPVALIILAVLAVLLGALAGYLYMSWQNSQDKLKDSQAQLKSSQSQLAAKNTELQAVTAQLVPYHDAKRKSDLASFADTVRAYNVKNHSHLTTEGSTASNIFATQLSKSITDFKDPKTGDTYGFVAVAPAQTPPPLKVGTIQYQWAGKCGAKTLEDTSDQTLSAVATLLEDGTMYCIQV